MDSVSEEANRPSTTETRRLLSIVCGFTAMADTDRRKPKYGDRVEDKSGRCWSQEAGKQEARIGGFRSVAGVGGGLTGGGGLGSAAVARRIRRSRSRERWLVGSFGAGFPEFAI
jgi:hypothetical protein